MANSHDNEPQDNYTLLVDAQDADWHETSAGLIFGVQALGDLLVELNPNNAPIAGAPYMAPLCRFLQMALPLIAEALTARMSSGESVRNTVIDERIRAALDAGLEQ